jgi:hypothetical protein
MPWRSSLTALTLVAALGGCGGGGTKAPAPPPTPKGTPDAAAAKAAQAYLDAYTAKNPRKICGLLAASIRKQLGGKKCVKTVKGTLTPTFPQQAVDKSYSTGDKAVITVQGSPRRLQLVREGGTWKVINGG